MIPRMPSATAKEMIAPRLPLSSFASDPLSGSVLLWISILVFGFGVADGAGETVCGGGGGPGMSPPAGRDRGVVAIDVVVCVCVCVCAGQENLI